MQSFRRRNIGIILMERGSLKAEQLEYVVEKLAVTKQRFGELCIREGFISEEELAQALSEQFNLEYTDLDNFRMDEELLNSLPTDAIYRFRFVPLEMTPEALVVAISDPTDVVKLDELELMLGHSLRIRLATESAIASVIKTGEGTRRVLREVSEDFMLQLVKETDRGEEILSVEAISDDTSPIIKLINTTILDALNRRASDIHIETSHDGVDIKYRIDGVLYRANETIDLHFQAPIISRLKVMSELDISERRIPQDGRFKVRFGEKSIDFRVSIMPSALGEDAVIRILDKESIASDLKGLTLENLGISEREIKRLRKKIREPYGMVLVTGPTGSGKTTTLYAALTEIHTGEDKIITIEDPVEYMLRGVLQIPVNEKKGLTFAKGLRSILRHDPDKIMVGEIRDRETAEIAVQSALTGHLVLTTVHANNVFDVFGRFTHMGIDPYAFVSALNGIWAQRLVRLNCPHCAVPHHPSDSELARVNLTRAETSGYQFKHGKGCGDCRGTGYRGRKAIAEILSLTDEIRELIIDKRPIRQIKEAARLNGTRSLREAALELVKRGDTTLDEIKRVTLHA